MSRVIVAGGGAAGMMAALSAGQRGHQVILLKRMKNLGKNCTLQEKGDAM